MHVCLCSIVCVFLAVGVCVCRCVSVCLRVGVCECVSVSQFVFKCLSVCVFYLFLCLSLSTNVC